ncbi:wax ester/triacylglycerol synthase family O-acyltransferase [Oleomonas cavernae]|uniref:diacylglycerol O-acyltransferase n=1 Tax=Oleomonas cavernae TaxID=2320859 RepID=A0A418WTC2_9PROT|nr:wax ester/triacylglycerol synthase family O-acyltransferase [Oleomonas cavernae]RJF94457.1 wax ester/triacylglycerol synthase family O-acyltransferase [Oleomonas cavernae]
MQQLSGIDTFFLNVESNTCPMHVGGLVILEPGEKAPKDGAFARISAHVESRLDRIPPMRRRLLTTPLDLDHPYWVEDPDFDLVHHLRHRALPGPGDTAQLTELVCELTSTRLDRNLPLWELHYVEGLAKGRVATITKMHHAAIDGVSGAEILTELLDLTEVPRVNPPPAKPWKPDHIPSLLKRLYTSARSMSRRPVDTFKLLRESWPLLASVSREAYERGKMILKGNATDGVMGLAPRTRFNTQITARRSYAYGSLSLARIKAVKNALGTTLNDVVMGICAEALRNYLNEKADLPPRALVAGIPMSIRSEAQKGTAGNQVVFLRASLHTDEPDPTIRLRKISADMAGAKEKMRAMPANLMGDWAKLPAPALMAQAARLYENFGIQNYHAPAFNVVISNVPGSPVPLYFAGMKVVSNHPISIPYHGAAFNITLMSYCGNLDYGLTADRDTVPDIEHFSDLMQQALTLLEARVAQAA